MKNANHGYLSLHVDEQLIIILFIPLSYRILIGGLEYIRCGHKKPEAQSNQGGPEHGIEYQYFISHLGDKTIAYVCTNRINRNIKDASRKGGQRQRIGCSWEHSLTHFVPEYRLAQL